jgi:NAD+ kinase
VAQRVDRIVVYGNPEKTGVEEVVRAVAEWCAPRSVVLAVSSELHEGFLAPLPTSDENLKLYDANDPDDDPFSGQEPSVLVCLGGDGTLLRAARRFWPLPAPVLGVNLGQLGFTASVEPDRVRQTLDQWELGRTRISERMALKVRWVRGGRAIEESIAINDVVLAKQSEGRLIHLTLRQGEEKVAAFGADGLIVSTPTGSTAYNLSAGGPIVHPDMRLLIATAICPHTLSARPVVLPPSPPLTLAFTFHRERNQAMLWIDGQKRWAIQPDDEITLEAAESPLRLIAGVTTGYFEKLRQKLLWNGDPEA